MIIDLRRKSQHPMAVVEKTWCRCLQRAVLGLILSLHGAWLYPRTDCWVQPLRRSVLGGVAVATAPGIAGIAGNAGIAGAEEAPELKSKWPAKECSWGGGSPRLADF